MLNNCSSFFQGRHLSCIKSSWEKMSAQFPLLDLTWRQCHLLRALRSLCGMSVDRIKSDACGSTITRTQKVKKKSINCQDKLRCQMKEKM